MEIQLWEIDRPKDYPKNARKWSPSAIAKVRASIREFGMVQPVVVDKDETIIIGHLRRRSAKEEGLTQIPVHVADYLSAAKVRALRLADNRTHEEATWDVELLAEELLAMKELSIDLEWTGFDSRELDQFTLKPDSAEDEVPPVPEAPVSQAGDLWLMGEHRLLCGDSTKAEDVARLMNGQKASLFATDPPYLVDYQGGNHPQSWANSDKTRDKHWDDYVDPANAVEFYAAFLRLGLEHSIPRVPVYQWHADLRRVVVAEAWSRAGLLLHQIIVWVKARPVLTRSHYMWQHEPCAYGWIQGNMPTRPPANEHTVWSINQVGESDGIHPTQKPAELFKRPISFHTEIGEICYEPFSGSGTCIAAAQVSDRRCFAMEISPAFVDVAVIRWQNLSGKLAKLDGVGCTFEEAKRGRRQAAEDALMEEAHEALDHA